MQVFGMPSYYFNPRSYKRSDSEQTLCSFALTTFQSTLLQEERRGSGSGIIYPPFISIHAPTRGATSLWMLQRNSGSISIHAPTRGATLFTMPFRHGPCISIHAPTRGATCCGMICCGNCCYFNPRSYKRSDYVFSLRYFNCRLFQSTLLQEERPPGLQH